MMLEIGSIDSIVAAIRPASVARFLNKFGYTRVGGKHGVADVFENSIGTLLALPMNRSASDYVRCMRALLEVFTDQNMPLDDVVGTIVFPDSDIFRYGIQTPETECGQMQLSYTYEVMHALYDVLRFSAAGVSTQRTEYRRISDAAKRFGDQCRFGQTEYGSFVMKVFCPTNPGAASQADVFGEPFGRQATRAVLENFGFLASKKSTDPSEPLPPTMNRQVATAVHRLQPRSSLGVSTEVALRFAPLPAAKDESPSPPRDLQVLDLGPFVFRNAQSIRDRLKKAEEFEREVLRGFIVELHKDRPLPKTEQSHEIKLDVKVGRTRRTVGLRLLPSAYHRAVTWHDANKEVDLDAVIDKRGQIWTVSELLDIKPVEGRPDEPGLFGRDEG